MSSLLNRFNVLLGVCLQQSKNCPGCDSKHTKRIGSNATLAHVRECHDCFLIYRWPKQSSRFNSIFYRREYSRVHRSAATDLPQAKELEAMTSQGFKGTARDFSDFIELFKLLGVKTVLDFGCSWGYGVFQFRQSGFDAVGYEVSEPRAEFGRSNLDVQIFGSETELLRSHNSFDLIFSSHVFEHLPTPNLAWDLFSKVARRGSFYLIEVPNCGGDSARRLGLNWGPFSSAIHPLSFTATYFRNSLEPSCRALSFISKPFNPHSVFEAFKKATPCDEPTGDDLVVLAVAS